MLPKPCGAGAGATESLGLEALLEARATAAARDPQSVTNARERGERC